MKVLHVITGLHTGGAEMMLYKLLRGMDLSRFETHVISLRERGPVGQLLEGLPVKVSYLGLRLPYALPLYLPRLRRIVRGIRPDVIQGWMYHGNLAAMVLGVRAPTLWNVRQTLYSLRLEKFPTAIVILVSRWLSRMPRKILYNSRLSAAQHEAIGFSGWNRLVIPNGFDPEAFHPLGPQEKRMVRERLGIPSEDLCIGLIGRFHPMKDHGNFLKAASLVLRKREDCRFILVGRGIETGNEELYRLARKCGVEGRTLFLGERKDIPDIMASLDIHVSASAHGEGFPNVVGEAMSSGVASVVTDVGDSAWIAGEAALVVPPRDPEALSEALLKLASGGPSLRDSMGRSGRERVLERFSLPSIVKQYENLYAQFSAGT